MSKSHVVFGILGVLLIGAMTLIGIGVYGGGSEGSVYEPYPLAHPGNAVALPRLQETVITIGYLTDLTGPAANIMAKQRMALHDLVKYFNEANLIPGVELEVVTYDGQLDPSRDIPGYEWLKERGADVIYTDVPDTPLTLKSIVEKDKTPLFAASGYEQMLDPPGYVFVIGTIPEYQAYTILDWIARNDWDYESNGPAKIGGASWPDSYSRSFMTAMQEYSMANPDQFEWVGGYLANFTFTWGAEVEALKDSDYVFPCVMPIAFMKEYTIANGAAKFVGADVHLSFLDMIAEAAMWDEIDGMLFIGSRYWWNDDERLVGVARELLQENHPEEAGESTQWGAGYVAMSATLSPMLDIIADTVEAVGAQNFSSQALYDAATSFCVEIDGTEVMAFTKTRRYSLSGYTVYEASTEDEAVIRAAEDWVPVLVEP